MSIKKVGKNRLLSINSVSRIYFPLLEPVLTAETFFGAAGFADFALSAVAAFGFAGAFFCAEVGATGDTLMTITTVWTRRRRRRTITAGNAARSCGTKMRRVHLALDVLIPLKKKQQQALLRAPASP